MKMYLKKERKNYFIKKYIFFIIVIVITFITINNQDKKVNLDSTLNFLLNKTTNKNEAIILKKSKEYLLSFYNTPDKHLLLLNNIIKAEKTEPVLNSDTASLIYLYNTHQTEEYSEKELVEYSIRPTVMVADYIIQDILNKNNYKTIVEERKIKDILNQNAWNYSSSYKASRILLEDIKLNNPSLKYFIDIHRDSLTKDKTTTTISDKSYAKILFVIGLENNNYEKNLKFTEEINTCLNKNYPTLSKGIYKKQGAGVNGIYNQDFSPYTILVEIGGYENTINEIMNSSNAFSICLMEVIKNH